MHRTPRGIRTLARGSLSLCVCVCLCVCACVRVRPCAGARWLPGACAGAAVQASRDFGDMAAGFHVACYRGPPLQTSPRSLSLSVYENPQSPKAGALGGGKSRAIPPRIRLETHPKPTEPGRAAHPTAPAPRRSARGTQHHGSNKSENQKKSQHQTLNLCRRLAPQHPNRSSHHTHPITQSHPHTRRDGAR